MGNKKKIYSLKYKNVTAGARKSSYVLKYNDKDATEVISGMTDSLTLTDVASGEADRVSLSLQNRDMKWVKGYFPSPSDFVRVWIKVQDWLETGDYYKGSFGKYQVDKFTASGLPHKFSLEGISIPIQTKFNVTARNKTYKSTSVKNIMKDIADRADIHLVYDAEPIKVREVSQSGQTDMEFGFSLCSDYGLAVKVYNGMLVVYDQTKYEKRASAFDIDMSQMGDSDSYSYERNIAGLYDSVKLQYSDKNSKTVNYEYKIPGKKGNRTLYLSESADSHADAERKAKAKLLASLRESERLTLNLMGHPQYQSCVTFDLIGFGRISGKYFVDRVIHRMDASYRTTLECHPVVTNIT